MDKVLGLQVLHTSRNLSQRSDQTFLKYSLCPSISVQHFNPTYIIVSLFYSLNYYMQFINFLLFIHYSLKYFVQFVQPNTLPSSLLQSHCSINFYFYINQLNHSHHHNFSSFPQCSVHTTCKIVHYLIMTVPVLRCT